MKGRKGDVASESRHATALRGARSRFQRPHHLQLSRSMLIRNIIVVKLIKSVIAHPADRKEGLWPVWRRVLRISTGRVWFALRAHRDISRVWGNRGAWRRMGPTHHLVTNVRFRKTKSTVSVKSVSEHATAPRIKASVNSVYNSSEIDKIRYCLPSR